MPRARENGLTVPSVALLGVIPVHSDHEVFIQGIKQKRRLKLNFFCRQNPGSIVLQCAPLYYSRGRTEGDGLSCYYVWIFEPVADNHFLALQPSQIVTMELDDDTFRIEDINSRQKEKVK